MARGCEGMAPGCSLGTPGAAGEGAGRRAGKTSVEASGTARETRAPRLFFEALFAPPELCRA